MDIENRISEVLSNNGSPTINNRSESELILYLKENYRLKLSWTHPEEYVVKLVCNEKDTVSQTFQKIEDWLECINGILKLFDLTIAYKNLHPVLKNFS